MAVSRLGHLMRDTLENRALPTRFVLLRSSSRHTPNHGLRGDNERESFKSSVANVRWSATIRALAFVAVEYTIVIKAARLSPDLSLGTITLVCQSALDIFHGPSTSRAAI